MAKQQEVVIDKDLFSDPGAVGAGGQALAKSPAVDLLALALSKDAAIDVIERLAKLQLEQRKLNAEEDFSLHLGLCQSEISTVIKTEPGVKGKKYATYEALDREVRPVYLRHGFSLSFGSETMSESTVLVTCLLSRGIHTRRYQLPMDCSGKGPQGGDALSKPHAMLAAMEYGRRGLLKMIFNIVTGEEDVVTNREVMEQVEWIHNASTKEKLTKLFKDAYIKFEANPAALRVIVDAKNEKRKDFD